MFRNYLLVTFRNLYRNKVYALINILGLGLALSICIVAYFNHMFGHDFDRSHEHFKEIYRVTSNRQMQDGEQEYGLVPAPLGPEIKKDFPAVKKAARIMRSYSPVKVGIDNFNRLVSYVDPDFLDMFSFHLIAGNKEALLDPNQVLISEDMALALYGKDEPIGQAITIYNDNNQEFTYTIGAVFEDLPLNSSFRIDILTNIQNFLTMWEVRDVNWQQFARILFLQIPDPGALSMIGLYTLVSLSILNRTKEIGIRKVMGSPLARIWLVLSRSFLLNLAISSVLGCVGGYYLSLMMLDSIWDYWLDFNAWIYIYAVLIILVATAVTITGKVYQAALQNPVDCLRYE